MLLRTARDAQRQECGAEEVVGERGACDGRVARRVPGGLHGAAGRVAQSGFEVDDAVAAEALAHDAQVGLRLHGEVEAYGSGGAVRDAADAEAAPPLRVGAGVLGDGGTRIGERLGERGAVAERGEGRAGGERGRLAAAARSGEEGDGAEAQDGRAVPGVGGETEFGQVRPGCGVRVPVGAAGLTGHARGAPRVGVVRAGRDGLWALGVLRGGAET